MTEPSGSAGVRRRDFLKVLGAAGAVTTTVGCFQEDVEKLIPYLVSPDDTVPGVSTYFASTCLLLREDTSGAKLGTQSSLGGSGQTRSALSVVSTISPVPPGRYSSNKL